MALEKTPVNIKKYRDPHATRASVETLKRLAELKDISEKHIEIIAYEASVRIAVAKEIMRLATNDDIPMLLEILSDEYSEVRDAAAKALGRLANLSDLPSLIRKIKRDYQVIRESAADSIAYLIMRGDVPEISEMLEREETYILEIVRKSLRRIAYGKGKSELQKMFNNLDFNHFNMTLTESQTLFTIVGMTGFYSIKSNNNC